MVRKSDLSTAIIDHIRKSIQNFTHNQESAVDIPAKTAVIIPITPLREHIANSPMIAEKIQ
jgi:hypothetical protein